MLEGGGTFVAFMIIFYVGYCYDRYQKQVGDPQDTPHPGTVLSAPHSPPSHSGTRFGSSRTCR